MGGDEKNEIASLRPNGGPSNTTNENKMIGLLFAFMAVDFALAQYVQQIVYGIPIIAMQAMVVRILGDRWGLSHYVTVSEWLPRREDKK